MSDSNYCHSKKILVKHLSNQIPPKVFRSSLGGNLAM